MIFDEFTHSQMRVAAALDGRKFDQKVMQSAVDAACDPAYHELYGSMTRAECTALLASKQHKSIFVNPRALQRVEYEKRNGSKEYFDVDENGERAPELAFRHPGTSWESDEEEERSDNKRFAPVKTAMIGPQLVGLAFARPGEASCTHLFPAFEAQLAVRVDNKRRALLYECCEFKPRALDVNGKLPTWREIDRFDNAVRIMGSSSHGAYYGASAPDDEAYLDEPVQPTAGLPTRALRMQALQGAVLDSRMLRLKVPLDSVVGARLVVGPRANIHDDSTGVLVLELGQPPASHAFAARKLASCFTAERLFSTVPDWTPGCCASAATRQYIFGWVTALRDLASHLGSLSAPIANMLASPIGARPATAGAANSLAPPISLAPADAPPFLATPLPSAEAAAAAAAERALPRGHAMAPADVDALLISRGLAAPQDVRNVNSCLKRAVLLGKLDLSEAAGSTVLHSGACVCCEAKIECTLSAALFQPECGYDYGDGGRKAAVQCAKCANGNYLTDLCKGKPSFDCGKFHKHCCECPDFGTCIGDIRERHCESCGEHYFVDMSGSQCDSCGGGHGRHGRKGLKLADMQPPHASTWDGVIEGCDKPLAAGCGALEAALSALREEDHDAKGVGGPNGLLACFIGGLLAAKDSDAGAGSAADKHRQSGLTGRSHGSSAAGIRARPAAEQAAAPSRKVPKTFKSPMKQTTVGSNK